MATFVQDGRTIDHTPGSDVAAGAVVVQGELVGVAKVPIPANTLGALAVEGVFDFAKEPGLAIAAGANCYWKAADEVVNTTATGNKLVGKAIRAAAAGDATVRVRMSQ